MKEAAYPSVLDQEHGALEAREKETPPMLKVVEETVVGKEGIGRERWTPKFGQLVKVESRPRRRSLECHGRDGVFRLN